jgi:hypothetical protein
MDARMCGVDIGCVTQSLQDPRMADLLRNVTEEIVQVQLSTSQLEGKVEAGLISPVRARRGRPPTAATRRTRADP